MCPHPIRAGISTDLRDPCRVTRAFIIIVAAAASAAAASAAQAPDELRPADAEVRPLPAGDHPFRFQTRRFVIAADAPLDRDTLARFARVVDAVPVALARLPLPLLVPPGGPPPRIEVLDDSAYETAGGHRGTIGYYDGRPPGRLLVRRKMLLAPPARRPTRLIPGPDQDLLVHELTHLCTHHYLGRTPQWFAEGVCEYLASLHHADGRFDFHNVDRAIRDHLRSRGDPADPTIVLTPVASLAGLSGPGWLKLVDRLGPGQSTRPYATALLLFHYHLHGGDARRDALRTRLDRTLASRRPDIDWLAPAEIPAIEAALTRYWKPKGLHLRFGNPEKP
jgi:hypothetical protein